VKYLNIPRDRGVYDAELLLRRRYVYGECIHI
jgi:hypothetical protein